MPDNDPAHIVGYDYDDLCPLCGDLREFCDGDCDLDPAHIDGWHYDDLCPRCGDLREFCDGGCSL